MNFKPELCDLVLCGTKTVTRRPIGDKPECQYKPGKDYAVCPGRGKHQLGRIKVISVWRELLEDITDKDAVLEGFADRAEFVHYWLKLYGRWDFGMPVWRIEFTVISVVTEAGGPDAQ